MNMSHSNFLFVYGTLMSASQHPMAQYLREHATFIGNGKLPGELFQVAHYPGAVKSQKSDSWVFGEVYEFNTSNSHSVLSKLDQYEECSQDFPEPHEYKRQLEAIFMGADVVFCWTYIYNKSTHKLQPIPSGQFINHSQTICQTY